MSCLRLLQHNFSLDEITVLEEAAQSQEMRVVVFCHGSDVLDVLAVSHRLL